MVDSLEDVIFELSEGSGPQQPSVVTVTKGSTSVPGQAGIRVPVPGISFTCRASIQPVDGRKLEQVSEGADAGELRTVFLVPDVPERVLTPTDRATGARGDFLTFGDGETYEVVEAHDWRATAGYIHCVAKRRYE